MENNGNPLTRLVGETLSSIEFVMDYYQLRFNGPYLTVINHPRLKTSAGWIKDDDKLFCYYVVTCIGQEVVSAIKDDESIKIDFQNGYEFFVSLKREDYRSEEAAHFNDGSGGWWIW